MACNGADRRRWSRSPRRRATSTPGRRTIIGFVAGIIVVRRRAHDRQGARRPGRRALGARAGRDLGNAVVRPVHRPDAGRAQRRSARAGFVYTGSFDQLVRPGVARVRPRSRPCSRSASRSSSRSRRTIGLRVKPEEESYGLDMAEHGMWGYPEQFMPVPGLRVPPAGAAGGASRAAAGAGRAGRGGRAVMPRAVRAIDARRPRR